MCFPSVTETGLPRTSLSVVTWSTQGGIQVLPKPTNLIEKLGGHRSSPFNTGPTNIVSVGHT